MSTIVSHSPLNISETVHVTQKGQNREPNPLRAQCLENSWRFYLAIIANRVYCEAVLVGYPSDSLASCYIYFFLATCARLS